MNPKNNARIRAEFSELQKKLETLDQELTVFLEKGQQQQTIQALVL